MNVEVVNLRRRPFFIVEELLQTIQANPQLWAIVEQLKHQDQEPDEFFLSVAKMLAVEFEELHKTDLKDKLAALFGPLPQESYVMVPLLCHVALDIFLMQAIPNQEAIRD